jgi:hypothetical protein
MIYSDKVIRRRREAVVAQALRARAAVADAISKTHRPDKVPREKHMKTLTLLTGRGIRID